MKKCYTLIFTLIWICSSLFGQDGTLDTSFGNNGTVSFPVGNDDSRIFAITKAGDKLVTAGFFNVGGTEQFTLFQFNLDGSVDTNFGSTGMAVPTQGPGNGRATCIAVQNDGKIVAGGWSRYGNKDQYFLFRVLADGTMDQSFGAAGVVTGNFSGSSFAEDEINALRILSDGKIVVAGRSYNGSNDDVFVACFNEDGSLNASFGTDNGYSIIDFGVNPPYELAEALEVDNQGNIFVGGSIDTGFNTEDAFFVLKMNSQGVIDNAFGDNGKVVKDLGDSVVAGLNDIDIDAQGRIVTAGGAFNTSEADNNFFLTRYLSNGTIDNSFGTDGVTILERGDNESVLDVKVLANGDIIAAGSTGGFGSQFAMVRLTDSGNQDLTFGNNGWALTMIESTFNGIESIVVDGDCIYAGGFGRGADIYNMAMAKYKNEGMSSSVEGISVADDLLNIYPNPIIENFSIEFELIQNTTINIQMIDASGKRTFSLLPTQNVTAGAQKFDFNTPKDMPKGNYFILLNFDNTVISKKVQFIK